MPNYCDNNLYLSHTDSAQIKRAKAALENQTLFSEFVPVAEDQSRTELWGTKWEPMSPYVTDVSDTSPFFLQCTFDTAWAPPIEFYNEMVKLGFNVIAEFSEPGCCFCGEYDNGTTTDYDTSEGYDNIPNYLQMQFGIGEYEESEENEESEE